MVSAKSLDYSKIVTTMLCDVQTLHSSVFTDRARRLTCKKLESRVAREGIGFLTKTLPRLGKGLDKALSGVEPLNASKYGFSSMPGSKLPRFLGELFQQVLDHNGVVLAAADVMCIRTLRQVLYVMYKLELEYSPEQEAAVLQKFIKTDEELATYSAHHSNLAVGMRRHGCVDYLRTRSEPEWYKRTIRNSRRILSRVFSRFDERDIYPRHGPGAVSTGERLWDKYRWTRISPRIEQTYPLDQYYYCSPGHVGDHLNEIFSLSSDEPLARVCLVAKDSRGPRLISCEPLEFQWIQQGLSRAIVDHVEHHPLTKWSVRFTEQRYNQIGALYGSQSGKYSTLDLNEASDRVSLGLVCMLFPEPLLGALVATRSLGTRLPNGKEIYFNKFAPMGSALCFPILALTVWSLLYSGLRALGANVLREDIAVYGDDVIVPAKFAEHAMIILESFGLKINRDKSCTKGFFRESCGLDAYKGIEVTPVRFRTPWSSLRRPEDYTSYIAYANSLYDRQYYSCYNYIVDQLLALYGPIPDERCRISAPALRNVPDTSPKPRRRYNRALQKHEYHVFDSVSTQRHKEMPGWRMLLRYFAEGTSTENVRRWRTADAMHGGQSSTAPLSVRGYTLRKRNKLRLRWR